MKAKIVKKEREDNIIPAGKLKVGQIGVLQEDYSNFVKKDSLFLCAYNQAIICLNNPTYTWDRYCNLQVKALPVGTVVQLTVEE